MIDTYESLSETSQRVRWKIEDVIGAPHRTLDFSKPFMPESLAQVNGLSFLNLEEKLKLNQLRGFEYLCMFALAEESIVPHLQEQDDLSQPERHRALVGFAGEELKHIRVFERFREEFEEGFGSKCDFVGPAYDVTRFVMSHRPLGVALMAHQFEWATLTHYTASVLDNHDLDQQFKRLLHFHWLEESQHVKIGGLMIEAMVKQMTADEIDQALVAYAGISVFLEQVIKLQAGLNVVNFLRAARRTVTPAELGELTETIVKGMRWTWIGSAMNPNFLATLEAVKPGAGKMPGIQDI